jgi:hypothetical protein
VERAAKPASQITGFAAYYWRCLVYQFLLLLLKFNPVPLLLVSLTTHRGRKAVLGTACLLPDQGNAWSGKKTKTI